ncbi:MAG: hypothetical protein PHN69_06595 [Candidatus Pacebacteria bacterium]|nr:hypothetical protein [Candidatus Paceibacterota bacterium]
MTIQESLILNKCDNCGKQILSDKVLKICPECGSKQINQYNHHVWDVIRE